MNYQSIHMILKNLALKLPSKFPNQCKELQKAAAPHVGWECPSLTFTYPGFDCGSHGIELYLTGSPWKVNDFLSIALLVGSALVTESYPHPACAHGSEPANNPADRGVVRVICEGSNFRSVSIGRLQGKASSLD